MNIVQKLRSPANIFYEFAADQGGMLKEAADQIEAQAKRIAELEAGLTASPETIRLYLGEMTAQEMRSVRAAFSWALARAVLKQD